MRNQYLKAALNSAKDHKKYLQNRRLTILIRKNTGIQDLSMLERFIFDWHDKGWNTAVADLPKTVYDSINPNTGATVHHETQKTVDDVNSVSQAVLGESLAQISQVQDEQAFFKDMMAKITAKVREDIGQQYMLDEQITAVKAEIADLTAQEKGESAAEASKA